MKMLKDKIDSSVESAASWLVVSANQLRKRDEGVTAVEYALILAGVALVALVALTPLGNAIGEVFGKAVCSVQSKTYPC
jgi:Flp pilus assembly pilin Flp